MLNNDKKSVNYGKFHYLFDRFQYIEEGTELEIEFVKSGLKGFIDVRIGFVKDETPDDVPTIEDDYITNDEVN